MRCTCTEVLAKSTASIFMQSMQQTNQATNQPDKQKKQINCRGNQPMQSLPIYIQYVYLGTHMTKVSFSYDFLPDWSLLLPVVTTKVAKDTRISTFPSYFRHYSFYILAMCFVVNMVGLSCDLFFSSEYIGRMSLQNLGTLLLDYTKSHTRRY